ncbi:MAG: sulfite exporter TauE/SafE family protein [Actinomycetaceae bacterium]
MELIVVATLIGILVGLVVGTLGAGGGVLTVPALAYLVGFSPHDAATASLVIVGVTSLVTLVPHAQRGNVRWAGGLTFGLLGAVAAVGGAWLAHLLDGPVLMALFSVLLLVVAGLMVRKARAERSELRRAEQEAAEEAEREAAGGAEDAAAETALDAELSAPDDAVGDPSAAMEADLTAAQGGAAQEADPTDPADDVGDPVLDPVADYPHRDTSLPAEPSPDNASSEVSRREEGSANDLGSTTDPTADPTTNSTSGPTTGQPTSEPTPVPPRTTVNPLLLVPVAALVGLLTGLFGVGGGFAAVPALILVLRFPVRAAVGTSLLVIVVNSAAGLAARIPEGLDLEWVPVICFAVASTIAGPAASRPPR